MNKFQRFSRYAFLTLMYKVFHRKDESHNGWFVRKRPITMLVLAPVLIPFFMLYGIILYWDWASRYYMKWMDADKKKLTFWQRIYIKDNLAD